MLRVILTAVFCLCGGAAIGYFFAFQQIDDVRHDAANLMGDTPVAASSKAPVANEGARIAPRALTTEEQVVAATQKPKAVGVIKGRVVDKTGRGVGGALFKARRSNFSDPRFLNRPGQVPDSVLGPEDLIAMLRERIERDPSLEVTALSDTNGDFALNGLENLAYNIESYLPNHLLVGMEGHDAFNGRWPGDVVQLRALPLSRLEVEVRLPDGSVPATAELSTRRTNSNETWQWTPEDRVVPLQPGMWTLQARGGDMCMFRSKEQLVEVTEGGAPTSVILELAERPLIRGRLIFDGPPPSKQYTVIAWSQNHDPATDNVWEATNTSDQARTFATTGFQFEDLEPGVYRLAVSDGGIERPPVLATVTLADKLVVQDLQVTASKSAEWVVKVLDPTGAAVDDAAFDTSFWMGNGNNWCRDLEGAWHGTVPRNVLDEPAGEPLQLTVRSGQWGHTALTLPRAAATAEVRMQAPGFLKAQLSGDSSTSRQKLSASLQLLGASRDHDSWVGSSPADESNSVTFSPLQPGTYMLRLSMNSGGWYGGQSVAERRLEIHSGENQASIAAPVLHMISVRMKNGGEAATGHMQLILPPDAKDAMPFSAGAQIDKDGLAKFENVPAGRYTLNFYSGGRNGSILITVPTAEIQIDLDVLRAMRIQLHSNDHILTEKGFKTGDLIVGVDGHEFTNGNDLETAMRFVGGKAEVPMMVLRDGQMLQLSMPGKLFVERNGFSWSLTTR